VSRRLTRPLVVALVLCCLPPLWGVTSPARAEDPVFVDWPSLLPSLTAGYDPSSANDCVAGRPRCLDAILREMRREFEPLAESCSHNAPFALAYWRITEGYGHVRDEPGYFEDVRFFNHVVAVFASYYLSAFQNWKDGDRAAVPQAWLIPFDAGRAGRSAARGTC